MKNINIRRSFGGPVIILEPSVKPQKKIGCNFVLDNNNKIILDRLFNYGIVIIDIFIYV